MSKDERIRYKGTLLTKLQAESIKKFKKEQDKKINKTINDVFNILVYVIFCIGNFGLFALFSYMSIDVLIQSHKLHSWIYFLWVILLMDCIFFAYQYVRCFEKEEGG